MSTFFQDRFTVAVWTESDETKSHRKKVRQEMPVGSDDPLDAAQALVSQLENMSDEARAQIARIRIDRPELEGEDDFSGFDLGDTESDGDEGEDS